MTTRAAKVSRARLVRLGRGDKGRSRVEARQSRVVAALNGHGPTMLEAELPFRELSRLAHADRRASDPVYAAHRWWARRPPSVMRGLLLAADLPAGTPSDHFWELFRSDGLALAGRRVHDLFVGGGTTVIEASRLGAIPSGTDVDPLAIEIVKHELRRPSATAVHEAGERLLSYVNERAAEFFAGTSTKWTPVHFFSIHEVECPDCERVSPLYRDLVIARASGKSGAVVRDEALVAFCPDCFSLHHLTQSDRREFRCCGQRHKLGGGTFARQRFTCPHCGGQATHRELKTGAAARRLVAIEESAEQQRRRIRAPRSKDYQLLNRAERRLESLRRILLLPQGKLRQRRIDERPLSFGINTPRELFTARQLIVFGLAFRWVKQAKLSRDVRRALTLAVSNALTTNNRLCSYAAEYGRLAPLFSVRGYSLPALAVELNPLHPSAGRGTLRRSIGRVVRSTDEVVRRYVWCSRRRRPVPTTMRFRARPPTNAIVCASAESRPTQLGGPIDLCLFDPPYFDYIAYSELSEFYRVWVGRSRLGGAPLLPDQTNPVRTFSDRLARCLLAVKPRLRKGRPMVFTYHSASSEAWTAIGRALDRAEMVVTGLWPLRNDSHMGHHSAKGNCEWDLVVICRRKSECRPAKPDTSVERWTNAVKPLRIGASDRLSMTHAIAMAAPRFGRPTHDRANGQGGPNER